MQRESSSSSARASSVHLLQPEPHLLASRRQLLRILHALISISIVVHLSVVRGNLEIRVVAPAIVVQAVALLRLLGDDPVVLHDPEDVVTGSLANKSVESQAQEGKQAHRSSG